MPTVELLNNGVTSTEGSECPDQTVSKEKKWAEHLLPTGILRAERCPACGYNVAAPFYEGGEKPLAMIAWPASRTEAESMPRLPLDYVRCLDCGHIFNARFTYDAVPYSVKPNLMFNRGATWTGFLAHLRDRTLQSLPGRPVVVEIGHGDGHFLAGLAAIRPQGRYIGFDPHGALDANHSSVELRAGLFDPVRHIVELKPDLIVSRHVLEHLTNPLSLLQNINSVAAWMDLSIQLLFEVPCVDRAIQYGRLGDFYYEHYSQFTTQSFTRMLTRAQVHLLTLGHGYDGEVVYAFSRTQNHADQLLRLHSALKFRAAAKESPGRMAGQLEALCTSKTRVAIWGGVGKCAAFLNTYGLDAERFPLVVDSDAGKAGTFVPGTGQEIQNCSILRHSPVDVIIIPAQWRAKDIVKEITAMGLACKVLIEHEGVMVDYENDAHPSRKRQEDGTTKNSQG